MLIEMLYAVGFDEAKLDTIQLRERAIIVEKLCEYMMFKSQYSAAGIKKEEIPVSEFLERINPELALELYVTRLDRNF
jgi:elongin-C